MLRITIFLISFFLFIKEGNAYESCPSLPDYRCFSLQEEIAREIEVQTGKTAVRAVVNLEQQLQQQQLVVSSVNDQVQICKQRLMLKDLQLENLQLELDTATQKIKNAPSRLTWFLSGAATASVLLLTVVVIK